MSAGHPRHRIDSLESRSMVAADVVISEFMSDNKFTIIDKLNQFSDWVELYNRGDAPQDLTNWHLTDKADQPALWKFPAGTVLAPNSFLLVRASGDGNNSGTAT